MKNILKVAAATFLLLSGTACSDFLDEDLKKELAPDNTYTSTYGFQVGVNGLYGWARSEFNTWGGGTASLSQACPYEAFQVATDIVYTGHKDGSLPVLYIFHDIRRKLLEMVVRPDCQRKRIAYLCR